MSDGRLKRVRLKFERDYTQIPNEWLRDPQLSLRARGLLALLMSHREGYVVTHKSLVATNPEGMTAIQAAVDELKKARYLAVTKERGAGGRVAGWTWELTDPAEEKRRSTPQLDIPDLEKPDLEKPDTDNQRLKEAQSEELSNLSTKADPGTRAGMKAEPFGQLLSLAAESDEARRQRLVHQKCRFHPSTEHDFASGSCPWCGIRSTQRWTSNGDVVLLDELLEAVSA